MKAGCWTLAILIFMTSCGKNVLSELGNPNSDDALLFDAKTAVDGQRYDEAITIVTTKVSTSGRTTTRAKEILASGYAGKCGLNFVNYINSLADSSAPQIFVMVSAPFVGKVVDPASCLSSLQVLQSIGTYQTRTTNQNTFAAVVAMVLMGSATRLYTDDLPLMGNGVQDAIKISCSLTDAQIDQVILGYGYMIENYAAISSQLGSNASVVSDAINVCGSVSCASTDPAQITLAMRTAMRAIMNTQQYGVGDFDASDTNNLPLSCL